MYPWQHCCYIVHGRILSRDVYGCSSVGRLTFFFSVFFLMYQSKSKSPGSIKSWFPWQHSSSARILSRDLPWRSTATGLLLTNSELNRITVHNFKGQRKFWYWSKHRFFLITLVFPWQHCCPWEHIRIFFYQIMQPEYSSSNAFQSFIILTLNRYSPERNVCISIKYVPQNTMG